MKTKTNRAARRRAAQLEARADKKRNRRWRTSAAALGVAAVVGMGMAGGAGTALADDVPPAAGMEMTPEMILGLLDDEMITGFVEMCRTGALANGNPNAGQSTNWNPEDTTTGTLPPGAIATCTDSTGHGLALVLPDRFEIGQLGNNMVIDLGPDIDVYDPITGWIKVVTLPMGKQNLLNLVSGLIFEGNDILGNNVKSIAEADYGVAIDPRMFSKYGNYETDIYNKIVADAALAPNWVEERYCNGTVIFGSCIGGGGWQYRTVDTNLQKRTDALKVASYLTGQKYTDYTQPVILPPLTGPKGQSVIKGDGINVALSMRDGRAFAETGNNISIALAGADKGKLSTAYAKWAIAIAANMDTEDIRFTWFGQDVDFSNLLPLLQSEMAKEALGEDGDMTPMLELIGTLNGQIPSIKEVFCFGVNAQATAEGLGSCSNYLGTFDTYKDLRALTDGSEDFTGDKVSRQEQYGLTDVSSLLFGNDALIKHLAPLLGGDGDLGSLMSNPFVVDMLAAVLSEDKRIKLTKDFIRYTKNVETVFEKVPVLDADGNPVTKPVKVTKQATNDDGELLWTLDGEDVTADEDGGVPEGAEPKMIEVTKQEQATDSDGNLLWEDDEQTVPTMVDVTEPVLKNKTTARMVGVFEDAWEKYVSDEPVMKTENVKIHAVDPDTGEKLYVDIDGNSVAEGAEGALPKLVDKTEQAKNADGELLWTLGGQDVTADEDGNPPAGATPKMVVVTEQIQEKNEDGSLKFKEKTRHFKKPVMVQQEVDGEKVWRDATDADGDFVWFDAEGNQLDDVDEDDLPEGAVKKAPVLVQKIEQAKDSKGNLLWDPVVAKTTTAHWLTSDYGLREPLVIQWGNHEVVFFPAVEVNGTYRPNLIGMPEIRRIADGASAGLLPKISLIQWDNPFGLGTLSLDKPFDIFGTARDFKKSITLDDDLKRLDNLLGPLLFGGDKRLTAEIGDSVKGFVTKPFQDLNDLLKPKPKDDAPVVDPEDPIEDEGDNGGDTGNAGDGGDTGNVGDSGNIGDTGTDGLDGGPEASTTTSTPEPELTVGSDDPAPAEKKSEGDLTTPSTTTQQSSAPQAPEVSSATEPSTSAEPADALEPALG